MLDVRIVKKTALNMATGADIPKEMYGMLENVTLVPAPPVSSVFVPLIITGK